jgi:hypothetical protein
MSADAPPDKRQLGTPVASGPRTWVQTERAAHEAWGRLTMKSPRAAALMHRLVSMMGHQNAVVVSQKTLAKLVGCSLDTIKRAVRELESERWIDVVRINGPGTVAAYVVNSAVAWGERRDLIGVLSVFHATVVADAEDQPEGALERKALRRVPIIVPPEEALLAGEGEPGAQIALPGMEPVVVSDGPGESPPAFTPLSPELIGKIHQMVVQALQHAQHDPKEKAAKADSEEPPESHRRASGPAAHPPRE